MKRSFVRIRTVDDQSALVNCHLFYTTKGTNLRLLVISSDTFPPRRVDVAVLFGSELAARGHTTDLILQSEAECHASRTEPWGGGRIWVGPTDTGGALWRRVRKHILSITQDLKVFLLARSEPYDFIEVKDKFISGLTALLAARIYGRRFIFWLSYPFGEDYLLRAKEGSARYPLLYVIRGSASRFLLYKVLMPAAVHVFVQSEQMRRDVALEGVPLEKTTAVPMGIDPDRFPALYDGRRRMIPAEELCFLYLGTLGRVRHLDFLVRVLAQVLSRLPTVKLYMVGKGDHPGDEQLLIDEATRLGVSGSLVMIGQLPQEEALRYVQEADVCVSPFFPTPVLNSTSPTKLVEYLAMGKAVVANDHPEQRMVIEESGGGYCVPWDEKAFADAIVTLLKSPPQAALMGRKGREYVLQHRTYKSIAALVERTLAGIIKADRDRICERPV